MATTKDVKKTPSGRVSYRGETFSGYNKPKRTPGKNKKFAVLAKKGSDVKLVRFGDPNMEIKKDDPARRKSFRARHNCDTAKDKFSARYWSCKKW
jgi:hydrogenase maturation factor